MAKLTTKQLETVIIKSLETRTHLKYEKDGADFLVYQADSGTTILYGIERLIQSCMGLGIDWYIEHDQELNRIQMRVYDN